MKRAPTVLAACSLIAAAPPGRYFPSSYETPQWQCDFDGGKSSTFEMLDSVEVGWFSRQLRAAGEPSLYRASLRPRREPAQTLRFLWLRSFHPGVVVRVEVRGTTARVIAKQLTGSGGYDPGEIGRHVDRRLSRAELARLRAMLDAAHLFEREAPPCDVVVDGSAWVMERVDRSGYRMAYRLSPANGALREIGLYLLGLTRWDLKPVY